MSSSLLQVIYFYFCAAFTLFGALATVAARNPIRGAMGLLLTIAGLAALFLSLSAEFLAVAQLLVYAGAVVVLFLFVLMLLGPDSQPPADRRAFAPRAAGVAGAVLVSGGLVSAILFWDGSGKVAPFPPLAGGEGTIESIAHEVFTVGVVPFELASALLLIAVVGAVAIARGRQGAGQRVVGGMPTPRPKITST